MSDFFLEMVSGHFFEMASDRLHYIFSLHIYNVFVDFFMASDHFF